MMRLIVVCITVLLAIGTRECQQTYRCALEIEDHYNARVAEIARLKFLNQERKPSIEIDPGVYRGREKL